MEHSGKRLSTFGQLPIITTPVGGISDVIRDGEEVFLVTPGSIDELARRIIELLESEELRRRMGENPRRRLRTEYSPEASLNTLIALYVWHGARLVAGASQARKAPLSDT
jgi:glycosyltransferase involved in cell wall biosynthesis